ncbi:MAG: DUF1446 domain-containing protein [Pseudomonadales bacterium]|nr:DUF1446 domain-containing protein [Pseudomonadales bacterium]MBO7004220.1 DUF1446 domain-containing protein [Pseudomonadales bacterium]
MARVPSLIRIAGGSGFWGESDMAVPQLLASGQVDYIAFDYLAEITMSILARARAKSQDAGYATDFVTDVIAPNLHDIEQQGVKLLSNAGGVNPLACAKEIEKLIAEAGLNLKVATITGDDLVNQAATFKDKQEMFSGAIFPDPEDVASINAYLGAFPIAEALGMGADIIVTGRCVDSALTLGACLHEFGWQPNDWDLLAAGSLAGHLIECGPQATGGNHTDWREIAANLDNIGYPIAEIGADGAMTITKPAGTGGQVTRGTVSEQMLYEIGDPRAYFLPDVICDFSGVSITEESQNRVQVSGAKGHPATATYKTSATYTDGSKIITLWYFIGKDSAEKADIFADAALKRTRRKLEALSLADFDEVSIEPFGSEVHFGNTHSESRETALRISAKHRNPKALSLLLKEATGLALATPPGMALHTGGRPSPSPVVRLFSFLVDKQEVGIKIHMNGEVCEHKIYGSNAEQLPRPKPPEPEIPAVPNKTIKVPLRQVAYGRSGDKGNNANIGIIARDPALLPQIYHQLSEARVAEVFHHFLNGGRVERFFLPGTSSINFLLHDVLGGGGVASLRSDTQGKSYAEILLDTDIEMPEEHLK